MRSKVANCSSCRRIEAAKISGVHASCLYGCCYRNSDGCCHWNLKHGGNNLNSSHQIHSFLLAQFLGGDVQQDLGVNICGASRGWGAGFVKVSALRLARTASCRSPSGMEKYLNDHRHSRQEGCSADCPGRLARNLWVSGKRRM